jgi:flagellar basal-body rod modification protein FlgD
MVDSTSGSSATNPAALSQISARIDASRSRLADAEETFMKLLTTQLRNQDPLSPLDSSQFTQQLVQMTSVEQQIYGNQLLESLVGQGGGSLTSAVGLIGRQVTAEGSITALSGGRANWAYNLPAQASDATLEVVDSTGRVVFSRAAETRPGSYTFEWDGRSATGAQLPDGDYRLLVTAHGTNGQAMTPTTYVTGVVSAVQTVDGTTQLTIGRQRVPITSVIGVTEAASQ